MQQGTGKQPERDAGGPPRNCNPTPLVGSASIPTTGLAIADTVQFNVRPHEPHPIELLIRDLTVRKELNKKGHLQTSSVANPAADPMPFQRLPATETRHGQSLPPQLNPIAVKRGRNDLSPKTLATINWKVVGAECRACWSHHYSEAECAALTLRLPKVCQQEYIDGDYLYFNQFQDWSLIKTQMSNLWASQPDHDYLMSTLPQRTIQDAVDAGFLPPFYADPVKCAEHIKAREKEVMAAARPGFTKEMAVACGLIPWNPWKPGKMRSADELVEEAKAVKLRYHAGP